ncbi:molybdopterin-dependent oxidoreductase [Sulfurovum sp.]|uniref:molybdopterin-dependent oxidoreductase n=1 Tax=Sulfurovum sp. TaxID=1969726 RepID=UPI002867F79B|nr:molybdopterin-dependent oxidoreductase [Sulfurovum sp.]
MERRDFFKKAAVVAGAAAIGTNTAEASTTKQPIDDQQIAKIAFPEKRPLIMYSDRPPLLETPRGIFTSVFTPNDLFFVRWHMPDIPTHIDPDTYTIHINGLVEKELHISLNDLKTKFEQVEITAVLQCGGNSRSAFKPIAGGIQWGSGAMGCAKWKGVRLRDLLNQAGLKKESKWIGFNGKETAAYYETPNFVRELHLDELDEQIILAYEMNGEDLPYLNGYPLRLIIPGFYSDSWVKMLSNITVTNEYKKLFFMDVAYRVPDNECECETPEKRFPKTKPITKMNVKSVIGYPTRESVVNHGSHVVVRGVAFDSGHGIKEVQVSIDAGKTWESAILDKAEEGKYAFRTFRYPFKPNSYGKLTIMTKAINEAGEVQPFAKDIKWNHGGYKYNGIDEVTVDVI